MPFAPGHFPVLVLDDDVATLTLEQRILARAGFSVMGASNLDVARQAIASGRVSLLILDYRLGGAASGLDFFRSLREEGHNLPAILVTSFSDESKVIEALRAGIRDVIPKSSDYLDYLPHAVTRIIEQVSTERQVAESEALKNLVDRLQEESQTLETIHQVGRMLAGELDLNRLVQTVTDACTKLIGARFGAFYNAVDPSGETYSRYTLTGLGADAFKDFLKSENPALFGPTLRGEGIVRADDITRDSRAGMQSPDRGQAPGPAVVRSYLAVPVVSRSAQVLGGMFFGHPNPGIFDDRDEHIVQSIAAQAGVAIDNARLVEALRSSEDSLRKNAEEREHLLESERAARAESERAGRLKDEFLATLSHELRTPLNAILGWTHLLRSRSGDARQMSEGLETIYRNAQVQTQIVDDLLEMSRIISGKLRLDFQRVDLPATVAAAVTTIKPAAEAKSIRLETALDRDAGPIFGDPARIQQILSNVLSNAIKFTPNDGRVRVLLDRVGSHIEITVSDTGQGIKAEFLPYLFDRFRQADASTTRQHRGMGLGLSIVKNLIDMHAGTITASSPGEGMGATFVIRLPIANASEGASAPSAALSQPQPSGEATPNLTGLRLLVVDDEADAREFLARVLSECGATVETSASTAEALRAVETRTPDVLISDIGMPHSDGYELIRTIRRLPMSRGGQIPALALTAFARSEDRQRALLAGYQAHLAKPFQPSELITQIASLAGRLWPVRTEP